MTNKNNKKLLKSSLTMRRGASTSPPLKTTRSAGRAVVSILEKEYRIIEIVGRIKTLMEK